MLSLLIPSIVTVPIQDKDLQQIVSEQPLFTDSEAACARFIFSEAIRVGALTSPSDKARHDGEPRMYCSCL